MLESHAKEIARASGADYDAAYPLQDSTWLRPEEPQVYPLPYRH